MGNQVTESTLSIRQNQKLFLYNVLLKYRYCIVNKCMAVLDGTALNISIKIY